VDYVARALEYAHEVAKNKGKQHGRWLQKAGKRYIQDLKRANKKKGAPFLFSAEQANKVCQFIELMPHVEGVWFNNDGSPQRTICLHRSHIFFLVQLFGFRKHDGTRRFTTALFAVARKNAKSTLAAAILLYCLCCEDEPGMQLVSAATTGSQARIIFNIAKRMAELTPALRAAFHIDCWASAVSRLTIGGSLKPINAKASTQDGLNPSHVALDEIHAHKTADLLNVLQSAMGARRNPLWLYTTTEGYENPGPWGELRQFAHKLLDGVFKTEADHFLAIIYAVDPNDDDFNERAWHKANPLLEVNPNLLNALRSNAVEAKNIPSQRAEFQIKRLNRPAAAADGFIDLSKWNACKGIIDLEDLQNYPCWAGLDLASTRDLTALRLVWRIDEKIITWGRRWVPESAVLQRTERGSAPYAGWVAAGLIEQTPGEVTDYTIIEAAIIEAHQRFNFQALAFDRWNAHELSQRLADADLPMIEFIQGTKSYHPAIQELERAYISKELVHDDDPVLRWCASNLVVRRDVNLNMAPDKRKSGDKIDDMTALLMAIGVSMRPDQKVDIDDMVQGIRTYLKIV